MSKEILTGKLSANRAVSAEPPTLVEKKKKEKKKRRGGLLLFLVAVGLGAVALGSISLLAPVTFYGHVDSPGSIDDVGKSGGNGIAVIPTALAASATATDGNGAEIENNGLTKSAEMTIAGYSDSNYSTELSCSIDLLPAFCSGSPITLSGLPPGEHVFSVIGSASDESAVQSFNWDILQ
jgi:hypothetical protein